MEKVGKNLIKLKNDIISLTQLTSKINQNNFNLKHKKSPTS